MSAATNANTRNWCFTLNNPTEEERQSFRNFEVAGLPRGLAFLVYQEERGHAEETAHFQGYLETSVSHKIGWLKNNFNGRAHYEPRMGTQAQAIAYCTKEDSRVPDGMRGSFGEPRGETSQEAKQKRIDTLDGIRKGTIRLRDVDSETLLNSGFLQAAKHILSTKLGPRREVEVITIVGGTGIGKSYACYSFCGDDLITYQRNGWFGGADTQGSNLLFDEFTGDLPFSDFLKYLDGYPMQLPIKGSFYPAHYTRVFITSNVMPENWWVSKGVENEELERKRHGQRQALYRRIGYSGPNGEYPQFENGHFIHIDENLSVQAARNTLKQRLLMIGIDIGEHPQGEHEDANFFTMHQPTGEEAVEQLAEDHLRTNLQEHPDRPLDQLERLFSNSLDD